MTLADIYVTYYTTFLDLGKVENDWNNFPKLRDLKKRVEEDEPIANWIKNRPVTDL